MSRALLIATTVVLVALLAGSMASAQYRYGDDQQAKQNKGRVGYYNPGDGSGGLAFGADFAAGKDIQVGVTYAETEVGGANVSIFPVVDITYMPPQETDYWAFEQPEQRTYYGGGITWARVGGGVDSSSFGYHLLAGSEFKGGQFFGEIRYSVVDVNGFDAGGLQLYAGMRF
jgi:hypothetical protein